MGRRNRFRRMRIRVKRRMMRRMWLRRWRWRRPRRRGDSSDHDSESSASSPQRWLLAPEPIRWHSFTRHSSSRTAAGATLRKVVVSRYMASCWMAWVPGSGWRSSHWSYRTHFCVGSGISFFLHLHLIGIKFPEPWHNQRGHDWAVIMFNESEYEDSVPAQVLTGDLPR